MDTMSAFILGETNRGNEPKVFDWDKAALIIRERSATNVSAGLNQDWGYTGAQIIEDGELILAKDFWGYLTSTWDTPVLEIEGERIECWLMKTQAPKEWEDFLVWPPSALAILFDEQPKITVEL